MSIRKRHPNTRFHRTPNDSITSNEETLISISSEAKFDQATWPHDEKELVVCETITFCTKICDWIKKCNEVPRVAKMRIRLTCLQKAHKRTQVLTNIHGGNLKENKQEKISYFAFVQRKSLK